jgi:hypothetical protein
MFNKGQSGNPKGRPVGAKNKLSKAIEICEQLGLNPLKQALEGIQKLDDGPEKIKLLFDACKFIYAIPKEKLDIDLTGIGDLVIIRSKPRSDEDPKA